MKKVLIITIGAISLLAAAFGIYYKLQLAQPDIDQILPQGALFYIQASDIKENWQELKETRLWRNLKRIDIEEVLKKSGVPEQEISEYLKYKDETSSFLSGLILDKFFGEEIGIAVYPVNIPSFSKKEALNALSSIVIVTRIKPEAKFAKAAAKVYNKFGKKIKLTQETYNKHKITSISIAYGLDLSCTTIKNLLIISPGSKYIRACIDTFNKQTLPLSKDRGYKWVKSQSPRKIRSITYLNLRKSANILRGIINLAIEASPSSGKDLDRAEESMNKLRGLETLGSYSIKDKNIFSDVTSLKVNSDILSPEFKTLFSSQPEENKALNFIPKDTLYYQWANSLNMEESWQKMKEEFSKETQKNMVNKGIPSPAVNKDKMADMIVSNIDTNLGYSFKNDILPLIGNEIGGILSDIDTGGFFPIPKLFLFLKVTDSSNAKEILKGIFNKQKVPLKDQGYKNIEIRYVSLPFGENLQPAYAFLNNYLIISSSKELLEKAIDTYRKDSPSIEENPLFKSVDFGLSGKNISSAFADTKNLINKAEDLAEWGMNWMTILKQKQKKQVEILKNKYVSLKEEIAKNKTGLSVLEKEKESLESEITSLENQALDTSEKEQRLSDLNMKIKLKESILSEKTKKARQYKQQMDKTKQSKTNKIDPELIRFYYNEVITPVMEGLKELEAIGTRTTISGEVLKIMYYSKSE